MITRLLELAAREPVAVRVLPVLLATIAYLVTRGTIDGEFGELLVALALAVLGGGAVVGARARVWTNPALAGRHARQELDE